MKNVLYVPNFNQNIIRLSNLLRTGYNIDGNKDVLHLRYRNECLAVRNADRQNMFYSLCIRRKSKREQNDRTNGCNNVNLQEFNAVIRKTELISPENIKVKITKRVWENRLLQ